MKRRSIFRFSLTALFVLVTAFCIWLGREVNRVRFEQEVADAVVKSDGHVRYGYEFDDSGQLIPDASPPKWTTIFGDGFFQEIVEVRYMGRISIDQTRDTGPIMSGVERKRIPNEILARLQHLRGLKTLVLSMTDVDDDDVDYLTALPQLESLRLDGNAISASSGEGFVALGNLRKLDLRQTKLTDIAVAELRESMPNTQIAFESITQVPDAFWTTMEGEIDLLSGGGL